MNGKPIMGDDGLMAMGWRTALLALVALAGMRAQGAPSGLVMHYSFDKAPVEGVVADLSGKKNHGKLAGANWTKAGKKGGGLECKGGSGGLRVAGSPSLHVKKATVATWFKVSKAHPHQRQVLRRGGLRLVIDGDAKSRGRMAVEVKGGPRCLSDAPVTNGAWHFAAATVDGAQLKLYIDGKLQKRVVACKAPIAAEPAGVLVGMDKPAAKGGHALDGFLDEVMVFNRALSALEINTLGSTIDPKIVVPVRKFSKNQIAGQIRALNALYEEGLLTDAYYTRKVRELQAMVAE